MNETDRRVVALLRVSTSAQAGPERGGLPGQRRTCDEVARMHGLTIVDTVTLDGVSGVEVQRDQRFSALLRRLQEPSIHGVIVADFDRLFRKGRWADFGILDSFADTGTVIYSTEGRIDPADESGEWVAGMRGIMSGSERRRLLARTRRGKEEKRRMGYRAEGDGRTSMPRGVLFDHETKRWSYTEPGASQVRAVFELFLGGGVRNFREIARRAGIYRPSSAGLSEAVRTILRQPLYMGIYRVDRRWIRDAVTRKPRAAKRSTEESYDVQVLDPPLVDPADWQRAQEILVRLRASRPVRREQGSLGLYHGFLECARCGSDLWVHPPHPRGGYAAYQCGGFRKKLCAQPQVTVRGADPAIDLALEARLGSEATLRRLLDTAAEETARRRAPTTDATRRLTELHNRRTRIQDGYERGLYSATEASKRIASIESEIASLTELLGRDTGPIELDPDVVDGLVDVFASWSDLAREEKRRLLASNRIRIRLLAVGPRKPPEIDSITLGILGELPDSVRVYKKMRRFGIE